VLRKSDQHLDFDLDLAKSQTNENPVYYIQYAHARVCSVLAQWDGDEARWPRPISRCSTIPRTGALAAKLAEFPKSVENAARDLAPHADRLLPQGSGRRIPQLLQRRAHAGRRRGAARCAPRARRWRCARCIRNGLAILGVSCPESM
jgi:arginyl-tRNA synthetase